MAPASTSATSSGDIRNRNSAGVIPATSSQAARRASSRLTGARGLGRPAILGRRVMRTRYGVRSISSGHTCAKNEFPEPIGDLVPTSWHQVTLHVHRDVDGRMPRERLEALRVLAVRDQQTRIGVAEIMTPDLAQARAPERRVETAVQ